MPTMLPAPSATAPCLRDVLPSCLAALAGDDNPLSLPAAESVVVVLVDGLGSASLRQRVGHARHLSSVFTAKATLTSGFPSTTAVALSSLTTGDAPGVHGIVGYTALVPKADVVLNQLSGWGPDMDPALWQRSSTIFERVAGTSVTATVVGPERYRDSGLTGAVLRGADYVAGSTLRDRFEAARRLLDRGPGQLVYVYVPELDMTAHASGWESSRWITALEELDGELKRFTDSLRPGHGVLVTADHGMVDVPEANHVLFGVDDGLLEGIKHVAGDPRCLQLHFDPAADEATRSRVIERWRESEQSRAWVATRQEAIESGWFGEVAPEVLPRIGDLMIAARKNIAYYDARKTVDTSRRMVGQHGSLTTEEIMVPLLRFGAFRRA